MDRIPEENQKRKQLIVALSLFSFILFAGLFLFFYYQVKEIRLNKYAEIHAIAQLKSNEIVRWLDERYSDADYFSTSPELKSLIREAEKTNVPASVRKEIDIVFARMKKNHRYEDILVTDREGHVLYSFDKSHILLDSSTAKTVSAALDSNKILRNDLYYSPNNKIIQLEIVAPIILDKEMKAALVFTINPVNFLYPMIQSWPTPSKSSETFLLRKEGNMAVYLNPLRHSQNVPLKMKFPLPGFKGFNHHPASEYEGSIEGRDYRGIRVLADVLHVPGTNWIMVAKIDIQEVFNDLKFRIIMVSFIFILLILFVFLSFAYSFNRKQKGIFEQLFLKEKELRMAQEEFRNAIQKLNADLEKRVEERTEQLKKINKELESFAYTVSHDLRTPLRAIDGFSAILSDDYRDKLNEEGRRIVKVIRQNAQRMGVLIDELLNFSRLGRSDIMLSPIAMKDLARLVFEELNPAAADHKIEITIDNLHPIEGDPSMIKQVWINLISNAVKFSSGIEPAKINISSMEEPHRIIYCIEDNGAGFDMKYYDKLFGVFQRLHSEKEFDGTGVGLAIVRQVILRHGGSVWAEGKCNEGAAFYFSLPK